MKRKIGRCLIPLLALALAFLLGCFVGRRSGRELRVRGVEGEHTATASPEAAAEAAEERALLDPNALPTLSEALDYPLNINTATVAELQLLPGIGASKAQAIADYRDEHGPFERVDALEQVPGIGAKTVENLMNYLTVGENDENPDH